MVRNRDWKMVVLLATALALGAGAVAACVIPWFYCKPPDADDENREATGIRDGTDPGSHSRSAAEENLNPATNIRINGISYVRVMVPHNSLTSQSTVPTSTMLDSATLNASSLKPVNEEVSHPVQVHNVKFDLQPSVNADPMISGQTNSEIIEEDSTKTENAMKFHNSKVSISKPEGTESSGSDFPNSGASYSGSINPDIVGVRVLIKNEGNACLRQPDSETSNPTDESTTEPTNRTSSAASEFLNPDSIRPYDGTTESKETLSLIAGSTDPESSVPTSLTKTEETSSTFLTTSDSSNPTNESSTSTINRISTAQESENSSSGPTKVLTTAVVESSEISDILETIQEVSTSPPASPSPKISQQLDNCSSKFNRTPYPWIGNDESITSTSTRASNRLRFRSIRRNRTSSIPGTPDSTQSALNRQDTEIRKTSRGSRYVEAFSGRIKKIWRGIKIETTPRNRRSKYDQQSETIKSLSAGKKNPDGHSTLISDDQRLLDNIRTRRSPTALPVSLLKTFEDRGIPVNDNSNCIPQFGIEENEEPLDLSIRSSPERKNEKTADMSTGKKRFDRSTDSCKEVFREVVEYWKIRKSSKSSEDVISVSDSLMFSNDVTKIRSKDENQNVTSDFSAVGNVKVEDYANSIRDSNKDKLDRSCLPKSNGFPRGIKKIFHIGSKDRSKRHKKLSPMQQGQVLNSATIKCSGNPASTSSQLKSELNVKVIRTPDSCTDMSSYFELGVGKSDDNRYHNEPCTEL